MEQRPTLRLDKWLWQARFCRTRPIAVELIEGGKVRINARVVRKVSAAVGPGDVLTLVHGDRVRVVRVLGLPGRRGPATEAQALYEESQERGVSSG